MSEGMLLVAVGCGRLHGILDTAAKHTFVVFGTMDAKALDGLIHYTEDGRGSSVPVHFYETG